MGIFNYFTSNKITTTPTTSNNGILDEELSRSLSYDDVRNLYSNYALANRIVNLPINLSVSNLETNIDEFNVDINIDDIIIKVKELVRIVRIYGMGVLLPNIEEDDVSKPLLKSDLFDKEIRYNVIEPLNLNTEIDLNPLSFHFRKIKNISINGKHIHNKRVLCLTNQSNNLYLKYNRAGLSYTGLSVFQNIYKLLVLLDTAQVSLERQMLHSSLMLLTQENTKINTSNIQQQIIEEQSRLIEQAKQNSTIILRNGYQLNQFQLNNLTSIQEVLSQINNLLALSTDIPAIIFEGNKISGGFSEGSMEMVQLENYLNNIRLELINPTFKFILTYEVYSKVKDIELADNILNNIEITYKKDYLNKEVIENAEELTSNGIMNKDEIKESIEG